MKLSDQKIIRNGGFSLLEILIVIIIISVVAGAAIPANFSGKDRIKLQTAANEIATLFRYARDQAIQTGQPHGVHIDPYSSRVYGFKSGGYANPLVGLIVLHNPISKLSTEVVVTNQHHTEGVSISNTESVFTYADRSNQDYVLFDETGLPYWKGGDGVFRLLVDSEITLSYSGELQSISLMAGYGRVILQ